ncbi:MAG: prkC 34 [Verrucomicrobiales bacterium]|nr:prkC 34 [Verrucomicrobiales bacterium]
MNESEANQNMENKCPQCGATLPTGALGGLCPACLLRQGVNSETSTQPASSPFQPPTVEEMKLKFPQLEIIEFLGKGGMGAVYKARQPALDRLVALKILAPHGANDTGFTERFSREARALAKLNHPNIIAVYEVGQTDGLPFFIMEYVDGLNLRQLQHAGKLSTREALKIVPQICEALQFAHDEGIVHRDIKPENILIDKKGRVKIADFGIAKIMGKSTPALEAVEGATAEPPIVPVPPITEEGKVIGTPNYMAPEQREQPQTVDHRADIFSLGVVFYEMLTGELPLGKFASPSARVGVDVRLDEVVLRALEKEPSRRYQHASHVKTAVDSISATPPPVPGVSATDMSRAILSQGYALNIGSCFGRSWDLLKREFWPLAGVTLLIYTLLGVAGSFTVLAGPNNHGGPQWQGSSLISMLVSGPLMGGLFLYFLKKIRREPVTIETAFSGFTTRFLHLFLGGFVTTALTVLGYFCLVLPGIYLMVAWMFTQVLIIDKKMDFWEAMELSRKVITRHWWKFLGFWILLTLVKVAGFIACIIGSFITIPLAIGALMYAYEDILGTEAVKKYVPSGPSGTVVMPGSSPSTTPMNPENKKVLTSLLFGGAIITILLIAFISIRNSRQRNTVSRSQENALREADAFVKKQQGFTQTHDVTLNDPNTDTRQSCLDLETGKLINWPGEWPRSPLSSLEMSNLLAQATPSLLEKGVDLVNDGSSDSIQAFLKASVEVDSHAFDNISVKDLVENDSLNSGTSGGDTRTSLTFSTPPATYLFRTREGTLGLLQIKSIDKNGKVRLRYKLAPHTSEMDKQKAKENLEARLEAATTIRDGNQRDDTLSSVVMQAAKAGEVDILKTALGEIRSANRKDQSAASAVHELSRIGHQREAIEIAKTIMSSNLRDSTLSGLAHKREE